MAAFSTQLQSELFERDYHMTDVHTSLYFDGINHHVKYVTSNSIYVYITAILYILIGKTLTPAIS